MSNHESTKIDLELRMSSSLLSAHGGDKSPRRRGRIWAALVDLVSQHPFGSVLVFLAMVSVVLYLPAVMTYFISDDFTQVWFLSSNISALLSGDKWAEWFLGVIDGYLYFRPATYALTLVDFLAWNNLAWGYHLTNLILHILSTFLVFLTSLQWTRRRITALATATLFAVLPTHAGAVSWMAAITDILCALLYLLSVLCFVLYRRRNQTLLYIISMGAFVFALASKEVAVMLPVVILLCDALFNFSLKAFRLTEWVKRHAAFWIILGLYLAFRFLGPGGFGYRGTQLNPQDVQNWIGGTLNLMMNPFATELTSIAEWALIGALVIILVLYRSRPAVVLGLVWIPLTFLPTINSVTGTSDRSFYIPSLGLCLVLASILTQPVDRPRMRLSQDFAPARWVSQRTRQNDQPHVHSFHWDKGAKAWLRTVGLVALTGLSLAYAAALYTQNRLYNQAGQVAEAIPRNLLALHPIFPPKSQLVFVGVPDNVSNGPLIYLTGFPGSIRLTYHDPGMAVYKFSKFPIWLDELDRMYFFQVDHRQVTERADLVHALEQRRQCQSALYPATQWDFAQDAAGWEPWNQLSDFLVRDGRLSTRAEGNDPYMVSPLTEIPSIAIGDVVVTMRVRSSKPEMQGRIYWLGADQSDFSPAFQMPFAVKADGEYHTYRVDISRSHQLALGDHITRLRLDPADAKAEIEIEDIQIYSHCAAVHGESCECPG